MGKLENNRRYDRKRRAQIFDILGRKCVHCGFLDERALQVDHVNGGGSKDRKERGSSVHRLLQSINERPLEFQVLCANCNWIKRAVRGENKPNSTK